MDEEKQNKHVEDGPVFAIDMDCNKLEESFFELWGQFVRRGVKPTEVLGQWMQCTFAITEAGVPNEVVVGWLLEVAQIALEVGSPAIRTGPAEKRFGKEFNRIARYLFREKRSSEPRV